MDSVNLYVLTSLSFDAKGIHYTGSVTSIIFSPDGRTLASGSGDYMVSGRELRALTGHTDSVSSVAFSFDRHTLASGGLENTIKLSNVFAGKPVSARGEPEPLKESCASGCGKPVESGLLHADVTERSG